VKYVFKSRKSEELRLAPGVIQPPFSFRFKAPSCQTQGSQSVIEEILKDASLHEIDGTWTLFFEGKEYMRLLDAKSRADAEQQIYEMLLVRNTEMAPLPPDSTKFAAKKFSEPDRNHRVE
jgi:hypothetical protein